MMVRKAHFPPARSIATNHPSNISMGSSTEQKQPLGPPAPSFVGCAAALLKNIITGNRNQRDTPMKTDIYRSLSITSVPADREQIDDLLSYGHNVVVR